MRVCVENLGILKQAEFELGDLTLICGGNNTGKTYATYAVYGFLSQWRRFLKFEISPKQIENLMEKGTIHIDVSICAEEADGVLSRGCQKYSEQLSRTFASKSSKFRDSSFQVKLGAETSVNAVGESFERVIGSKKTKFLSLSKQAQDKDLVVSLLFDSSALDLPPPGIFADMISDALVEIVFGQIFPNPFIASAERTGAAIFRKELNFARNRLLEEMTRTDKDIEPIELLFKSYQDYALPVKANAEFMRQLETIAKGDSFLAEDYPQILNDFSDIIGGEYITGSNDTIFFRPTRQQVKLTMDESSSAVRSLLDIGFYLRHVAKCGDLLMVDEPELNLHPENQRRIARLFATLVNLGFKVFITTHSDYIVKELNTLIMLNQNKPYLRRIAEKESYRSCEILSAENVKVYIAEKAPIMIKGNSRKSNCQTLVAADVDPNLGIEARSFDTVINKMNEIYDAIIWGDDE